MNFNFELILFYATLITGLISLFDIVFLGPMRYKKEDSKFEIILSNARSFFPILLIVFLLRSFLFEPFRIPTGSLEPTLLTGDFIIVNKFDYGLRLPVIHKKIISTDLPKRGDIIVFRWPPNPSVNFIKRVIGIPGDKISYINKTLYINGQKIQQDDGVQTTVHNENGEWTALKKQENLLGLKHMIYVDPAKQSRDYDNIEVPQGMYFVMGDNRDDSQDSRYWGFVPEENIVGKAVMVWLSWDSNDKRVRFNRFGNLVH